jgi:formylglycine-generating enzyme required for sulfatase activity
VQFDKVLRAFETGGFTYLDVRSQLKLILAKGASPSELIETLRRRERVEPLPPQAHEEVLRLLNEAAEHQAEANSPQADVSVGEAPDETPAPSEADLSGGSTSLAETVRGLQDQLAQQSAEFESLARAHERAKDAQSAASERVTALAAALASATRSLEAEQSKNREYVKALAERSASAEAHQAGGEELLRKARDYDVELRGAREALAKREIDLAALRQEHAVLARELLERNKGLPQLRAELADTRARLESEERQVRALQQSHTDAAAGAESLRVQVDEALQISQRNAAEARDLRAALADRDATLAAMEQARANAAHKQAAADAESLRAETLEALRISRLHEAEARDLRAALTDRDATLAAMEQASANAAHAQAAADAESLRAETLEALRISQRHETEARDLRAALADRDAKLAAVEQERADTVTRLKRARFDLDAARNELSSVKAQAHAYFDLLRTREWRRASEQLFSSVDAAVGAPVRRVAAPLVYAWVAMALLLAATIAFFVLRGTSSAPISVAVPANVAAGTVIHDCPTCPAMVVLPAGRFKQGANDGENASSYDKPRHWVAIAHPFAMSMNTVTLDEYAAFVAATGRDMQSCDVYDGAWKHNSAGSWKNPGFTQTGEHPVTCVSWNDAQAYASWISSNAGHRYRLPSASEWEYAARAGTESALPWGNVATDTCAHANVADRTAAQQFPGWSVFGCTDGWVFTAPVGSFKPNAFALNDMLGNVFQWTQDCWTADYVGAPVDGSARVDGNCAQRELRGGSWFSDPSYVRTNYRNHFATDYRTSSVGIRLVREME